MVDHHGGLICQLRTAFNGHDRPGYTSDQCTVISGRSTNHENRIRSCQVQSLHHSRQHDRFHQITTGRYLDIFIHIGDALPAFFHEHFARQRAHDVEHTAVRDLGGP